METIQVKILPDGKAKEVNPLGNEQPPDNWPRGDEAVWAHNTVLKMKDDLRFWHEAESKLRTYDVERCEKNCVAGFDCDCGREGSIHKAQILNSVTVKILS